MPAQTQSCSCGLTLEVTVACVLASCQRMAAATSDHFLELTLGILSAGLHAIQRATDKASCRWQRLTI